MRSKKRTIGILIVVIVVLLGFAGSLLIYRNKLSSEKTKNNSNNNIAQSLSSAPSGKSIENFYDKPITDEKIALDSIEANRDKLGYSDENFTFIYDEKSGSKTAYHFDLYYKDIPVYSPVGIRGVSVITHYDNSAKVLITGVSDSDKIIKVNAIPKVTEDEALNIAKEFLGKELSEYLISADFKQVKIYPKLIIYETNNEYVLAYYIESNYICVVDAENGNIITSRNTLVSNVSEYEGQNGDKHQVFYDDYEDDNHHIANMLYNKDKKIYIFNDVDGEQNYIPQNVLTINEIQSGKNKSAVDAMANTYRAVEYYENKFNMTFNATYVEVNDDDEAKNNSAGRVLIDSSGSHFANIIFGVYSFKNQDSCRLDDVGHEYTHVVTNLKVFGNGYSEDSKYFERNALMEAYSDIFGQLIEQEYTGKTDWVQSDTKRDLKNPKINSYSKKRKTKDDKGTKSNDYGYAHDNSTIISHTAFLMSKGNNNDKYNNTILLDYNQLAQLWYGSLEYLQKTKFMTFSDCRYAIEQSAMDLIEKGVLIDGNLKIIEQAFNEVEVSSNPSRHGAENGVEIKEKHTATVPIENETQSTEPVEITEIPTEPTTQTSAIDLIDKTLPEIISLMNGEYQIIKTENDGYIYIQNQSVLSGMEFYVQVSGDDIISANNGEEIHSDTLKAKLESGELTLDGIQVNKTGKVSETIQADMDYKSCSKVLGDFNCIGGTGGYLGGDVSSLSYYYNDKNAKVILNFNIPEEIYKDLILGKISSVSSEEMKSYNPNLRNVVIRKVETVTTMQTEAKENLIELVPSGKISCYGEHRGAITNNGDLYLWGNNSDGQLGTVTDEFIKVYWDKNGIISTPIKVMENVACASLGYDTSAVITNDGSLYTWGCGRYGRLGNGDDDNSIEPIKIMDNAVSVSLGFEAGAVITNDSSLFVWGYNLYGLGNGDSGPFKSPVKIMDNVKKVKLGGDNGAVITNDDVLYIWGSNIWGQLGNGETTDNMKSPVQVMDKVKDISFGDYYCAILSNSGDIYICGRIVTNKGVIGTASVPTKLEISQQAKEISCCGNTIYFIGEDDCLYEMIKHNSPVKIMENVNCISSNVAITNDGCMYTWGSNECGQLGNGTTEDSNEPIKVMDNVMLSEN